MSTLAELRTMVARDLRDEGMTTFTPEYIDDLINAGIEEVSRVYPKEIIEHIDLVADTDDYPFVSPITNVIRVEIRRDGAFYSTVVQNEDVDSSQGGWEVFAGALRVPNGMTNSLNPSTDEFWVWAYGDRAQLAADDDMADLDVPGEWGVRRFAKATAYALMQNDRALFKQWQAQNLNTDVTVNQLNAMVGLYASEWDRSRNHLRRLRRI